jgi:xanthine dehydrogenase accessory factor
MKSIFHHICTLLDHGEAIVLASIYSHSGSTPRTTGARMIVRSDTSILGTIGGGLLEAQVIEFAKEVSAKKSTVIRQFSLSGKDASQMEMICGGKVNVLIEYLDPSDGQQIEFYKSVAAVVGGSKKAWIMTELPTTRNGEMSRPRRCLVHSDGAVVGDLSIKLHPGLGSPIGLFDSEGTHALEEPDIASAREPVVINVEGQNYLIEPVGVLGTVYIFGGGHISQQLAPLAKLVGFNIVIIDDREEFCNRQRFPDGEDLVLVQSFDDLEKHIVIEPNGYLIIVTRGHLHDKTVLSYALKAKTRYIGMIGSLRKRDAVYQQIMDEEGYLPEVFTKVHSPIGLEIGAESPEEIAISIVAELIKVRSGIH